MDNSQYGQQSLDGNLFALISDWNPSNFFEIRDVVFVIYNSLLFFIFNPKLRRIAAQRISLSCPPGGDFGSPVTFFRYLAANIGVF